MSVDIGGLVILGDGKLVLHSMVHSSTGLRFSSVVNLMGKIGVASWARVVDRYLGMEVRG